MVRKSFSGGKKCYGGKKSKSKTPKSKKTRSKGKKNCSGIMIIEMGIEPMMPGMDKGDKLHHLKNHHTSKGNVRKSAKGMPGSRLAYDDTIQEKRKKSNKKLRSRSKSKSKLSTLKGNVRRGAMSMPGSRLAYDDTMQEKRKMRRMTMGGKNKKKTKKKSNKSAYSDFLSKELKRVGDAHPDWPQPKVFKEAVSNWSNKKGGKCGMKHGG